MLFIIYNNFIVIFYGIDIVRCRFNMSAFLWYASAASICDYKTEFQNDSNDKTKRLMVCS